MAQYRVKNTSHLDKAFKVYGGFDVVPAGASKDVLKALELTDDQIAALAFEGVKVKAFAGEDAGDAGSDRDENGDTPDMAQLRTMFDASWKKLSGDHEKAAADLVIASGNVSTLKDRVTELEGQITTKDAEIDALKKGQTGGDQTNTVSSIAEALALFSADGVHVNTAKAKAKAFLGDKVKADANKDEVFAALLADASDTELKTYLGAKGVEVKDETRDDLIKLALAA